MAFPNYAGVPALLRIPQVAGGLAVGTALINLMDLLAPRWGIYTADGAVALEPDNFLEVGYVNVSNLSTYPQEEGAFASYNKVQTPRACSVTVSKGGTKKAMVDFATALESLQASLDLYTIVTPARSYENMNVDRCEYRRSSSSGAGIVIATLHFTEIRQASAVFPQNGAISASNAPATALPSASNGQTYPTANPPTPSGVL